MNQYLYKGLTTILTKSILKKKIRDSSFIMCIIAVIFTPTVNQVCVHILCHARHLFTDSVYCVRE